MNSTLLLNCVLLNALTDCIHVAAQHITAKMSFNSIVLLSSSPPPPSPLAAVTALETALAPQSSTHVAPALLLLAPPPSSPTRTVTALGCAMAPSRLTRAASASNQRKTEASLKTGTAMASVSEPQSQTAVESVSTELLIGRLVQRWTSVPSAMEMAPRASGAME